jgi:hypothetical protein
MSEKRVKDLARKSRYLGHEFAHVIVPFCSEDKKRHLGLHVVSDWEQDEIKIETEHTVAAITKRWMRCTNGMCANTHFVMSQ